MVIESGYVDWETFDPTVLTPEVLNAFEPTVIFNVAGSTAAGTAPTARAELNAVDYYGTEDVYVVGTRSESGTTFALLADKSSGWVVTFYVNGKPEDWTSSGSTVAEQPVKVVTLESEFGETASAWGTEMSISAPELLDVPAQLDNATELDAQIQVVLVTVTNTMTDRSREFKPSWVEGEDQDGIAYKVSIQWQAEPIGDGHIAIGETLRTYVGFSLPKGSRLVSVTYDPLYDGPISATWAE